MSYKDQPIHIREVQITDMDILSLANLMTELGYETAHNEMKVRLTHIQKYGDYKTYLATMNNKVVGMIGMTKNYYYERNGIYVRVLALVIDQGFRKLGIGKQLMKVSEEWARKIGADRILLNCGNREDRKIAQRFYKKIGYQIKSSGFVKNL